MSKVTQINVLTDMQHQESRTQALESNRHPQNWPIFSGFKDKQMHLSKSYCMKTCIVENGQQVYLKLKNGEISLAVTFSG